MKARLVELGMWIVLHPGEFAIFVMKVWAFATVIAGIVLWRQGKQAPKEPKAPGFPSRRVG